MVLLLSSANQQAPVFLPPQIKISIDLSSKYLVLSDLTRKCFLVLHHFSAHNVTTDIENDVAKCTAISEFILAYPVVSYAIIDSQSSSMLPPLSQAQDSENNYLATMIRLYCIHTKQLQEMTIFVNGEQSVNANSSVSPTPQLNTAVESNGVLLASASQNGSNSSLLQHQTLPENKRKMNASMEYKRNVEQDTFKLKSLKTLRVSRNYSPALIKLIIKECTKSTRQGTMKPFEFLNLKNNRSPNPKLI